MATLDALSGRLRAELGDLARSFVDSFTGDGTTTRYQLNQAPVQGSSLTVSIYNPAINAAVGGASYSAGFVTYTHNSTSPITVGRIVTVSGLATTAWNVTNAAVTASTSNTFTVANATSGSTITLAVGASVVASASTVDISSLVTIEEGDGILTIPSANTPLNNSVITVAGQAYRYFTDSEIAYYVNTAFSQHTLHATNSFGSSITQLAFLPQIDEFPVVILASSLALYTLANDSSFDIDIISPDGVSIPRSERYRQLSEIVMQRTEQYKELCAILGTGLYRVEITSLRRISRLTNRYIPIYRPQEVDDWSLPQRVYLNMPTYGDTTLPSTVMQMDLTAYSGDDFSIDFGFSMDLTNYVPEAQIRLYQNAQFSQVGPILLASFTITKLTATGGTYPTLLRLTLAGAITANLPKVSYYDVQLTDSGGNVKTYLTGKLFTSPQVSL